MQQFSWDIELSGKCFLKCPKCIREDKKLKNNWVETEISLEFIKRIFKPDFVKNNIKRILFCGGVGDPIYCNDFLKIIKYFKEVKPDITLSIVTNGSYRNKNWWMELSQILNVYDIITFSIDGWDNKSNNLYRVNSNFDSILKGLKIITTMSKAHVAWSTIVFKFNQNKIKQIEDIARFYKAHYFQLVFSSLFEDDDYLKPDKKYITNLSFVYRKQVKQINPNIYRTNEIQKVADNYQEIIYRENKTTPFCKTGSKGLHVNSEGYLFPCSWIAHPFNIRENLKWEDSFFIKNKKHFNLNKYTLNEILKSKHWKIFEDSLINNPFIICKQKCIE